MRVTPATLAAILLLAARAAVPAPVDGARIYEDPWAWAHPQSVTVVGDELYPDAKFKGVFQSRSFFWRDRLDNGIVFTVNLFHWQYSVFTQWGLTVLVTDTEGRVYKFEGAPPEKDRSDPRSGFSLHFGSNSFEETPGGGCRIKIVQQAFSCDLTLTPLLPPWKPGDGWALYTRDAGEYSRYSSPSPWAELDGTMTVFGRTVSGEGQCLWDSCITVQPLSRTNSLITAFRAFSAPDDPTGGRTFISAMVTWTSERYGPLPVPMLLVARDGEWVFTTKDFSFESSGWTSQPNPPFPWPSRYTVSGGDGAARLEGSFESERMYHAMDVFESLNPFLRGIAVLFLKRPVYYRTVGRFQGTLTMQSGEEVALDLPAAGEYVILK